MVYVHLKDPSIHSPICTTTKKKKKKRRGGGSTITSPALNFSTIYIEENTTAHASQKEKKLKKSIDLFYRHNATAHLTY